jgi:hypothetical protein
LISTLVDASSVGSWPFASSVAEAVVCARLAPKMEASESGAMVPP